MKYKRFFGHSFVGKPARYGASGAAVMRSGGTEAVSREGWRKDRSQDGLDFDEGHNLPRMTSVLPTCNETASRFLTEGRISLHMLFVERQGSAGPVVFMIHWLGGSSRSWTEVAQPLARNGFRCVAVDLPGFGRSADDERYSVGAMVDALIETISSVRGDECERPWLLAGHSMGGKLAAMIASASANGHPGLENLHGLVLVSPSPPDPEPMQESKREEMLQALEPSADHADIRRAHAEKFVDDNTGKLPMIEEVRTRSVDDVLRMNPAALVAWLTAGSKEDRSQYVAELKLPTLIMAGTAEEALGPSAQKKHTLPHFVNATLVALEGCGHLAPLERPWEVSDRMLEFFRGIGIKPEPESSVLNAKFSAVIASDRTSPQTRNVLLDRMQDEPQVAAALDVEELRILRALAACVIPDAGFDLASRVDRTLAQSRHDGWRFATLPADVEAWKRGVASLNASSSREFDVPFVALDASRQGDMLKRAGDGALGKGLLASLHLERGAEIFNATQMRDWFEDVRGELAKLYVADPRTMERIGFTGFADEKGFTKIKLGDQEEVEA